MWLFQNHTSHHHNHLAIYVQRSKAIRECNCCRMSFINRVKKWAPATVWRVYYFPWSNDGCISIQLRTIAKEKSIMCHDDVIKWNHSPRYWPFVRGIHRGPVNSPHKGQWLGAFMFSLICAWITVEQTIVRLVIWDAIAPLWRHCNAMFGRDNFGEFRLQAKCRSGATMSNWWIYLYILNIGTIRYRHFDIQLAYVFITHNCLNLYVCLSTRYTQTLVKWPYSSDTFKLL